MKYASFWQRFVAAWVDVFVLVPLLAVQLWLGAMSKTAALVLVIPMSAVYLVYTIYCHGRFGQTVGKYAMGIRVVKTTGERIGWREAWLRSAVDIGFAVLGVAASFGALTAISDAAYYGMSFTERTASLEALQPPWLAWHSVAGQVWVWSEVVVVLFNEKRRAFHDFIAGTVVVVSERRTPAAQMHVA